MNKLINLLVEDLKEQRKDVIEELKNAQNAERFCLQMLEAIDSTINFIEISNKKNNELKEQIQNKEIK